MTGHGLRLASRRGAPPFGAPPGKPPAVEEDRATEFAWRIHAAQVSWASNADLKASILLALESGALYALISAFGGRSHPIANAVGILYLLLAIVAATIAIFPRLGQKDKNLDRHRQVIYFGDLRRWNAATLCSHIAGLAEGEELEMLGRQLTEISKHNWSKHRWVQISLILSLAGIVTIAASTAISL